MKQRAMSLVGTFILSAVVLACLASHSAAQVNRKQERETLSEERPTSGARSFEELFTKLERDWMEAVQSKDDTALESIVAPEFTVLSSDQPENPLPRAEWIRRALEGTDAGSYRHRAIRIRAFLGVAVVSFVQSREATCDGENCSGDYMVVDLWEANHNRWQVFARYISPVMGRPAHSAEAVK